MKNRCFLKRMRLSYFDESRLSLFLELFYQGIVGFFELGGRFFAAKVEEDFESGISVAVEELKGQRFVLVEMTGLAEGEDGIQFPAADVHIE